MALSFNELTVPMLQDCLENKGFTDAKLMSFQLEPVPEPGQTADITFIRLQYEHPSAAPASLIAKQRSSYEDAAAFLDLIGGGRREVNFYQQIAPDCPLNVPGCFYAQHDEQTNKFLLILEDCTGPLAGDWITATVAQAADLAESIAELHVVWWDSKDLSSMSWLSDFSSRPGSELGILVNNFQASGEAFLEVYKDDITSEFADTVRAMLAKPSLINAFDEAPATLIHGDFHFRNAFFPEKDPPLIFDWQVAGRGPAAVDLTRTFMFLTGPDADAGIDSILQNYLKRVTDAGIDYTFDQLRKDVCIGYIYSQWLGILAFMETDVEIIRAIFKARGSSITDLVCELDKRLDHAGVNDYIASY